MPQMKKGFYCLGAAIYHGEYPQEHVSGGFNLSGVRLEAVKTDVPFTEHDFAVKLYDNHALTEQEIREMERAVKIVLACLNIYEFQEVTFEKAEQKLGIAFPKEVKLLYTALEQWEGFYSDKERFLPLEEVYIDDGNLVFYKIRRTPVALSLTEGVLMSYYKKEWDYNPGDESYLCYALDKMVVKAITQMPVSRKGKIKGKLKSTLSPKKSLREIFKGRLMILEEYRNYGNIILFNEKGVLGWFRQNGFYADILVGSMNENLLEEILTSELPVMWE